MYFKKKENNGQKITNFGNDVSGHYKRHYHFHFFSLSQPFLIEGVLGSNTSLAAKGALANRLQRRTACKIQNGRQGARKWQRGSGKVSTPRFLGVLSNFR